MILRYDPVDLKNRRKTQLKNEEGNVLYWGIYDFAFKYRTRIYDSSDTEQGYVQLDLSRSVPEVVFYDNEDKPVGSMTVKDGSYLITPEGLLFTGDCAKGEITNVMKNTDGAIEIENGADPFRCVMVLFASVEIARGEEA